MKDRSTPVCAVVTFLTQIFLYLCIPKVWGCFIASEVNLEFVVFEVYGLLAGCWSAFALKRSSPAIRVFLWLNIFIFLIGSTVFFLAMVK